MPNPVFVIEWFKEIKIMEYEIKKEDKFEYLEVGEGETLMLFHGLFGALSNFSDLIDRYSAIFLNEMITIIYHRAFFRNLAQSNYEGEKDDLHHFLKNVNWRKVGDRFTRNHEADLLKLESASLFL